MWYKTSVTAEYYICELMCFKCCIEFLKQCLARNEGRINLNYATQCESGVFNRASL